MTPDQRQVTPQMPMERVTAAPAPSTAAFETAVIFPLMSPKITEEITIAVHIHAIANLERLLTGTDCPHEKYIGDLILL